MNMMMSLMTTCYSKVRTTYSMRTLEMGTSIITVETRNSSLKKATKQILTKLTRDRTQMVDSQSFVKVLTYSMVPLIRNLETIGHHSSQANLSLSRRIMTWAMTKELISWLLLMAYNPCIKKMTLEL